jgi:2-polyprenyl-3-methyl-5-hydroxy-6-metoxy-1,4-benzoquinol methylase
MTEFTEEWIRLNNFKFSMQNEVARLPETELDRKIIDRQLIPFIQNSYPDKKDINILDIGCNEGYAMEKFSELGYTNVQGITIEKEEWDKCKAKDLKVHLMDYNFNQVMNNYFHVVWMRQSLQFSHMPFFTLLELNRMMKINGWAYIEVPHSTNEHKYYATLHPDNYRLFMIRAGFEIVQYDYYELNSDGKSERHVFFALNKRRNIQLANADTISDK